MCEPPVQRFAGYFNSVGGKCAVLLRLGRKEEARVRLRRHPDRAANPGTKASWLSQHGEDAPIRATERADQLLYEGDIEGPLVWRAIVRAMEKLQREHRGGRGEAVN
jgi:hypothetical protein